MNSSDFDSRPRPGLLARVAAMRFFSFSLLFHVALVMLAGSVVIYKRKIDPPDFEAGSGELIAAADPTNQPPPEQPEQSTPQYQAAAPTATSSLDAITATTTNPSAFQIAPAVSMAKLEGKLANLPSAGGGLGDKIAGLGGGGMAGGSGRFFGMKQNKTSTGLLGHFYDAKQTRSRKPTGMDVNQFSDLVTKFVEGGWRDSSLHEYYRAPATLSATQIFIPNMPADEGPKAFEVEKEVEPSRWLVHYHGSVSPPKTGTYRFVGAGDDYLVVRINNKLVLDHGFAKATKWEPERYYDYGFTGVPKGFARGDRFHAVAGQFYDMDILISERPGGLVFFCLLIEEEGEEYPKEGHGLPVLPIFRLANTPVPELKAGQTFPPYEANGPVWRAAPPSNASALP